ncbi:MAG TPA: PSD1 and planctomycete cytochrome C domain-containing protein [Planctomycetota bacterium]|nr:PSD1 and planctomycete cytochrome C domain-containing protein [Planctomycetota bacterium]
MRLRFIAPLVGALAPALFAADAKLSYNRDIRPIFSENCFACHGPDKNKRATDMRLDVKELAFAKLKEGGFAIVPGDVKQSTLLARVASTEPEEHMPPRKFGKTLTEAQIATLKKWIEQGAVYEGHWAYVPPVLAAVPPVANEKWCRNAIDRFILARLESEKIAPSAEADKGTLLRRVNLDLIGLPPTPEELAAFTADNSENAYEKVVDRLLASPHFGERMAIYWLDLVRYADSIGCHSDNSRNVAPFRDWVINAFNSNMAFDEFTREQLAGDLLPNASLQQKVASGYNRLLMTTEEGGAQPKEYENKYNADRVRNVSAVWLASTMGCCECHDHKFDPFSAKDFYSMGAFFADVKEAPVGRREDGMLVPDAAQGAELAKLDSQIADAKKRLDTSTPELITAQAEWETKTRGEKHVNWTPLQPFVVESAQGAKLQIQKDKASVLASGKNPDEDVYTIRAKTKQKGITAFRLDVLPEKSLPQNGPGRAGNGNFVISQISITAQAANVPPASRRPIELQNASASIEQRILADASLAKAWDAASTISGKEVPGKAGWAVLDNSGKAGKAEQLVFETKEDLGTGDEIELVITINQNHGGQHTLGHFKLSATSDARPVKAGKDLPKEISDALALDEAKRTPQQKNALAAHYRSIASLLDSARKELAALEAKKADVLKNVPYTLVAMSGEPRVCRIKPRGNFLDDSGPVVTPDVPAALPKLQIEKRRPNRLDLANWIVAKENPLTARVFVNRLWKLFFGLGISKSLEDFGAQGEWPSHPELLDWLAVDFREHGWDMKRAVKQIVMSETYRQSSAGRKDLKERDPFNRLLARQGSFILDAEIVRDNALAISGLLSEKIGGASVKPYQPDGYWMHLNFPARTYVADKGENEYRRGLYTHWQRTFLHPSLLAFGASTREECCAERVRSNIPQQALVLLNDPTYVEAARAFAQKILKEGGTDTEGRLKFAFVRALARAPSTKEREVLAKLLAKHFDDFSKDKAAAEKLLSVGDFRAEKDLKVEELAAWTSVARAILNLHETITRN